MARIIRLDHDVKEMRDSSYLSEIVVSQMTKYIILTYMLLARWQRTCKVVANSTMT